MKPSLTQHIQALCLCCFIKHASTVDLCCHLEPHVRKESHNYSALSTLSSRQGMMDGIYSLAMSDGLYQDSRAKYPRTVKVKIKFLMKKQTV